MHVFTGPAGHFGGIWGPKLPNLVLPPSWPPSWRSLYCRHLHNIGFTYPLSNLLRTLRSIFILNSFSASSLKSLLTFRFHSWHCLICSRVFFFFNYAALFLNSVIHRPAYISILYAGLLFFMFDLYSLLFPIIWHS